MRICIEYSVLSIGNVIFFFLFVAKTGVVTALPRREKGDRKKVVLRPGYGKTTCLIIHVK